MAAHRPNADGPTPFGLRVDVDARTIALTGSLDLAAGVLFFAAGHTFVYEIPGDLTVDLEQVTSADAGFVATLCAVQTDLALAESDLILANTSTEVKRVLLASGFSARRTRRADAPPASAFPRTPLHQRHLAVVRGDPNV